MVIGARTKWLLKGAVAIALLGWLLARVDLHSLRRLISGQPLAGLLAAFLLQWAVIVVATAKWQLLLPGQGFVRLFRLNMAAQFYALVFPGQVAAEAVKAYQLGRGRIDAQTIATSVLFDKVTSLIALLALGLAGALTTELSIGRTLKSALLALFLVGIAALLALRFQSIEAIAVRTVADAGKRFSKAQRLFGQLALVIRAWADYSSRPLPLWGSLVVGIVQQMLHIAIVVVLAGDLNLEIGLLEWCWIFTLVSIAAFLPISLAGAGVREGTFVGLLALFGIPGEQALALSLTLFALQVLLGLIGGAMELGRFAAAR